jgi:hypothetical protein
MQFYGLIISHPKGTAMSARAASIAWTVGSAAGQNGN